MLIHESQDELKPLCMPEGEVLIQPRALKPRLRPGQRVGGVAEGPFVSLSHLPKLSVCSFDLTHPLSPSLSSCLPTGDSETIPLASFPFSSKIADGLPPFRLRSASFAVPFFPLVPSPFSSLSLLYPSALPRLPPFLHSLDKRSTSYSRRGRKPLLY